MIRVRVTRAQLSDLVEKECPGWSESAQVLKRRVQQGGTVRRQDDIWNRVKLVFMRLQGFKCAYCESALPQADRDSLKHVALASDVDHFRPKGRVQPWPTEDVLARRSDLDYASRVRSGPARGYARLAFDPGNYVVACKVCNSSYKRDHFPIAGRPDRRSLQRERLNAHEQPLLLFPLGDANDDPERFLTFDGWLVKPRPTRGQARLRARVTIDLFELNTRESLWRERAWVVVALWPQLEDAQRGGVDTSAAHRVVEARQRGEGPHAACARAFVRLHAHDPARAQRLYESAREYLGSIEPAAVPPVG